MKIAVVDDEKRWREETEHNIKKYYKDGRAVIDTFDSEESFLKNCEYYDIVFMDIELTGMDGFEVSRQYKKKYRDSVIVMLITHLEMSRKGYQVEAFRYLDKTHIEEEMEEALQRLEAILDRNKRIDINVVNHGTISIAYKDIIFLETDRRNVLVHTYNQKIVCKGTMREFEKILGDKEFCRTHKSYIVNMRAVKNFDDKDIYMVNGEIAMLSKSKCSEFKRAYIQKKFEYVNA